MERITTEREWIRIWIGRKWLQWLFDFFESPHSLSLKTWYHWMGLGSRDGQIFMKLNGAHAVFTIISDGNTPILLWLSVYQSMLTRNVTLATAKMSAVCAASRCSVVVRVWIISNLKFIVLALNSLNEFRCVVTLLHVPSSSQQSAAGGEMRKKRNSYWRESLGDPIRRMNSKQKPYWYYLLRIDSVNCGDVNIRSIWNDNSSERYSR